MLGPLTTHATLHAALFPLENRADVLFLGRRGNGSQTGPAELASMTKESLLNPYWTAHSFPSSSFFPLFFLLSSFIPSSIIIWNPLLLIIITLLYRRDVNNSATLGFPLPYGQLYSGHKFSSGFLKLSCFVNELLMNLWTYDL